MGYFYQPSDLWSNNMLTEVVESNNMLTKVVWSNDMSTEESEVK